jgi:hypothetical protein
METLSLITLSRLTNSSWLHGEFFLTPLQLRFAYDAFQGRYLNGNVLAPEPSTSCGLDSVGAICDRYQQKTLTPCQLASNLPAPRSVIGVKELG